MVVDEEERRVEGRVDLEALAAAPAGKVAPEAERDRARAVADGALAVPAALGAQA